MAVAGLILEDARNLEQDDDDDDHHEDGQGAFQCHAAGPSGGFPMSTIVPGFSKVAALAIVCTEGGA
jgi:hypothetical protein